MSDCHVYIIAAAIDGWLKGPVKVGMAFDAHKRLATIQTGHPHELQIAAYFTMPSRGVAREVEQAFHTVMSGKRMKGEWFDIDVITAIHAMCVNIRTALQINTELSPAEMEAALLFAGVTATEANLKKHGHIIEGPPIQ